MTGDGGTVITERGVLVAPTALDSNPTLGDGIATKIDAGEATGVFTHYEHASGLALPQRAIRTWPSPPTAPAQPIPVPWRPSPRCLSFRS